MAAQALQTLMPGRQLPAKPRHLGALQVRDLGERAGVVMAQHGCQGPSGASRPVLSQGRELPVGAEEQATIRAADQ